jgi:3-oxoadipyl-CoA thiolase
MAKINNDHDAVIVSAKRSPIGRLRGALSSVRPDDLLAAVLRAAVDDAGIDPIEIDEVVAGAANQAGEDNRNVARMALLLAGFPDTVPGVTVNRLCASGLEAVVQAARGIWSGEFNVAMAGGVESMSRAPWVMAKPDMGLPSGVPQMFDSALGWRFHNLSMEDLFPLEAMGETAENVAARYGISRSAQDAFALLSHQRAVKAESKGAFDKERVGIAVAQKKGDAIHVLKDEGPRPETTLEKLSQLKPAFRQNGSVTAGNSSSLNDGAAALALTSRAFARAHGLRVRAVIRGGRAVGVDPRFMGLGPIPATSKLFKQLGLTAKDMDAVELNEAFAAQTIAVMRELDLDEEKTNFYGGAIALGHPLGCSGARILTTLLSVLERQEGTLGLATMCVGVGQGLSVVIERE